MTRGAPEHDQYASESVGLEPVRLVGAHRGKADRAALDLAALDREEQHA